MTFILHLLYFVWMIAHQSVWHQPLQLCRAQTLTYIHKCVCGHYCLAKHSIGWFTIWFSVSLSDGFFFSFCVLNFHLQMPLQRNWKLTAKNESDFVDISFTARYCILFVCNFSFTLLFNSWQCKNVSELMLVSLDWLRRWVKNYLWLAK